MRRAVWAGHGRTPMAQAAGKLSRECSGSLLAQEADTLGNKREDANAPSNGTARWGAKWKGVVGVKVGQRKLKVHRRNNKPMESVWRLLHARKGRRKGRVHTKAKAEKEMRKEPSKRRMLSCSVALLIYGLAGAFGPSGGQAERDLRVASDGFRSQADYGCTRAPMHEITALACLDMELRSLDNGKRRSMRWSSAPSEELVRRETEIGVGGGMKWRQGGRWKEMHRSRIRTMG